MADIGLVSQLLKTNGLTWVQAQRVLHRPSGQALDDRDRKAFEPFFLAETLDLVRVKYVPALANPPFYADLASRGGPQPLDFSEMHGITFADTVLLSRKFVTPGPGARPLLFHELVHVVQYQLLGVDGFINRYVDGWTSNGRQYPAIPLERMAYNLQERFEKNPHDIFSVNQTVAERLKY
jgi:hypothetical protein